MYSSVYLGWQRGPVAAAGTAVRTRTRNTEDQVCVEKGSSPSLQSSSRRQRRALYDPLPDVGCRSSAWHLAVGTAPGPGPGSLSFTTAATRTRAPGPAPAPRIYDIYMPRPPGPPRQPYSTRCECACGLLPRARCRAQRTIGPATGVVAWSAPVPHYPHLLVTNISAHT